MKQLIRPKDKLGNWGTFTTYYKLDTWQGRRAILRKVKRVQDLHPDSTVVVEYYKDTVLASPYDVAEYPPLKQQMGEGRLKELAQEARNERLSYGEIAEIEQAYDEIVLGKYLPDDKDELLALDMIEQISKKKGWTL
jgi:predicted phosphohydrolase